MKPVCRPKPKCDVPEANYCDEFCDPIDWRMFCNMPSMVLPPHVHFRVINVKDQDELSEVKTVGLDGRPFKDESYGKTLSFLKPTIMPGLVPILLNTGKSPLYSKVLEDGVAAGKTIKVTIKNFCPGAIVHFWAALPLDEKDRSMKWPDKAYGSPTANSGIAIADDKGVLTIDIWKPQCYKVPDWKKVMHGPWRRKLRGMKMGHNKMHAREVRGRSKYMPVYAAIGTDLSKLDAMSKSLIFNP